MGEMNDGAMRTAVDRSDIRTRDLPDMRTTRWLCYTDSSSTVERVKSPPCCEDELVLIFRN